MSGSHPRLSLQKLLNSVFLSKQAVYVCFKTGSFTDESLPRGGFIPAETLVLNGTAGDNGTGGTLHQPVLGFLVG